MLDKEGQKLADKVEAAYKASRSGGLHKWAGKKALHNRMTFPEWSTDYISSVHAIILSVICCMIEDGDCIILKEARVK